MAPSAPNMKKISKKFQAPSRLPRKDLWGKKNENPSYQKSHTWAPSENPLM